MPRKPQSTGSTVAPTVPLNPTTLQILGVSEVAAMLGVPTSTVYEMCRYRGANRGNQIPYRKVGRYVKFILSEVQDWLLKTPLQTKTHKRAYRRKTAAKSKVAA